MKEVSHGLTLPGAAAFALAAMTAAGAQAQPNADELLARVGERVAEFYRRAKNVVCIETSTVQQIDLNNSPEGFARTVESELRLEADDGQVSGEAAIVRKVRKVNGRVPREQGQEGPRGMHRPESTVVRTACVSVTGAPIGVQIQDRGNCERQKPDCPDDRFLVGGA